MTFEPLKFLSNWNDPARDIGIIVSIAGTIGGAIWTRKKLFKTECPNVDLSASDPDKDGWREMTAIIKANNFNGRLFSITRKRWLHRTDLFFAKAESQPGPVFTEDRLKEWAKRDKAKEYSMIDLSKDEIYVNNGARYIFYCKSQTNHMTLYFTFEKGENDRKKIKRKVISN